MLATILALHLSVHTLQYVGLQLCGCHTALTAGMGALEFSVRTLGHMLFYSLQTASPLAPSVNMGTVYCQLTDLSSRSSVWIYLYVVQLYIFIIYYSAQW